MAVVEGATSAAAAGVVAVAEGGRRREQTRAGDSTVRSGARGLSNVLEQLGPFLLGANILRLVVPLELFVLKDLRGPTFPARSASSQQR